MRERGGVGPAPGAGRREVPNLARRRGVPVRARGCRGVRRCGAAVLRSPRPHQHRGSGAVRERAGGPRRASGAGPSDERGHAGPRSTRDVAAGPGGNADSASPVPHRTGGRSPAAARPRRGGPGGAPRPVPAAAGCGAPSPPCGCRARPHRCGVRAQPRGRRRPGMRGRCGGSGGGPSAQEFPAAPGEELESGRGLRGTSRAAGNGRGAVGRPGGRGGGGAAQGSDHIWLCAARGRAGVLRRGAGGGPCPEPGRGRGWGAEPRLTARVGWDGGRGSHPGSVPSGVDGAGAVPPVRVLRGGVSP